MSQNFKHLYPQLDESFVVVNNSIPKIAQNLQEPTLARKPSKEKTLSDSQQKEQTEYAFECLKKLKVDLEALQMLVDNIGKEKVEEASQFCINTFQLIDNLSQMTESRQYMFTMQNLNEIQKKIGEYITDLARVQEPGMEQPSIQQNKSKIFAPPEPEQGIFNLNCKVFNKKELAERSRAFINSERLLLDLEFSKVAWKNEEGIKYTSFVLLQAPILGSLYIRIKAEKNTTPEVLALLWDQISQRTDLQNLAIHMSGCPNASQEIIERLFSDIFKYNVLPKLQTFVFIGTELPLILPDFWNNQNYPFLERLENVVIDTSHLESSSSSENNSIFLRMKSKNIDIETLHNLDQLEESFQAVHQNAQFILAPALQFSSSHLKLRQIFTSIKSKDLILESEEFDDIYNQFCAIEQPCNVPTETIKLLMSLNQLYKDEENESLSFVHKYSVVSSEDSRLVYSFEFWAKFLLNNKNQKLENILKKILSPIPSKDNEKSVKMQIAFCVGCSLHLFFTKPDGWLLESVNSIKKVLQWYESFEGSLVKRNQKVLSLKVFLTVIQYSIKNWKSMKVCIQELKQLDGIREEYKILEQEQSDAESIKKIAFRNCDEQDLVWLKKTFKAAGLS